MIADTADNQRQQKLKRIANEQILFAECVFSPCNILKLVALSFRVAYASIPYGFYTLFLVNVSTWFWVVLHPGM